MSEFERRGLPDYNEGRNVETAYSAFQKMHGSVRNAMAEFRIVGTDGSLVQSRIPDDLITDKSPVLENIELPLALKQRIIRNYKIVLPLIEASMAIIRAEHDPDKLDINFATSKFNLALFPYNLKVEEGSWSDDTQEDLDEQNKSGQNIYSANRPETRYNTFFKDLNYMSESYLNYRLNSGMNESELLPILRQPLLSYNLRSPTAELIPHGKWNNSPYMMGFADIVNSAEYLYELFSFGIIQNPSWPEVANSTKSLGDNELHLRRIGSLTGAMRDILKDGTYPVPAHSVASPATLALEVGYAIDWYNLKVVLG